jgi:hypothetical protein
MMKTIVGITNEVDIMGDRREVDAMWPVSLHSSHVTRASTILRARVLKLLHKKINLGGEYVHLFKLVNLVGAGLSVLLILALVRGHLLNQFMSFLNTKSEERTSSNNIYMCLG